MNRGIVARCDDRGLGVLTWEAVRHLSPERVLVVREPGAERQGFVPHLDRYPGATVVTFDPVRGALPEAECREWLLGLDVVYTAETGYDARFFDWCRAEGVRSVLHAMPEFWRADPNLSKPDVVWNPTAWRHDTLPEGSRVVPVPVATDRFAGRVRGGAPSFVHVMGKRAARDRNGSQTVTEALRYVQRPMRVILRSQEGTWPRVRVSSRVEVILERAAENYWQLYDGADVLVLPRRYGGLCLPLNEALGAGLVAIGTDRDPERDEWPMVLVPSRVRGGFEAPGGQLEMSHVDPRDLAKAMDSLVADADLLVDLQEASAKWVEARSWSALLPLYEDEFARVLG